MNLGNGYAYVGSNPFVDPGGCGIKQLTDLAIKEISKFIGGKLSESVQGMVSYLSSPVSEDSAVVLPAFPLLFRSHQNRGEGERQGKR